MSVDELIVVEGRAPLVWVAPHGGARDAARRPWASGPLRVNDLHTGALATELAAMSGGSALVNATADRNDVDLNRVGETHARAPWFLERLAGVLEAAVARHGRATVLTVHGWNVIQPALDVGLGCARGADPYAVPPRAAVSPAFAAAAVRGLVDACRAEGLAATVGARYPARHPENLLQLFTPRYANDARSAVRRLAALAPRVDAVQLELGIALRWPGPWRARLVAACRAALPLLAGGRGARATPAPALAPDGAPAAPVARRLEFASGGLSGLASLDAGRGGRLLLFPPSGGLLLFTGERTGGEPPARVGGLTIAPAAGGATRVRYRGPMLRFPDTTAFLDLEHGLRRADLVPADVTLDFVPRHAGGAEPGDFGRLAGEATLDGTRFAVDAVAFGEGGAAPAPWPRVRLALHLGADRALVATIAIPSGEAQGFLCRAGAHVGVAAARVTLDADVGPRAVVVELRLADGERLRIEARALHRLPVVRVRPAPVRLDYLACAVDGGPVPAGWCEVAGL
ncbi:MAG TPA: hypothetical protein VFD84_02245 [Candidatus Binatia bacterium]|nr:hypothetical protein [Candidatus Binatia bacterium]